MSYVLQLVTDHVSRALSLVIDRFRRPRADAFLSAIIAEVQEVDTALVNMQRGVDVDTAVGAGLDLIGKILATPRFGMNDDQYRLRLKVEILVLNSNGRPEDLAAIIRVAWGLGFEIHEYDYATTLIVLTDPVVDLTFPGQLLAYFKRAKSVATRVLLQYNVTASRFSFAPAADFAMSATLGFSDSTDPSAGGGLMSSVIE